MVSRNERKLEKRGDFGNYGLVQLIKNLKLKCFSAQTILTSAYML